MIATLELTFEANRARADAETIGEAKRIVEGETTEEELRELAVLVTKLLREVARYPDLARGHWADFYSRARNGKVQDYNEEGRRWERTFDEWMRSCRIAQETSAAFRQAGVELEGAERLPMVRQDLERMRRQALDHWPWYDEADAREAVAQCERGECRTPEEILRELPGRDSPEHP